MSKAKVTVIGGGAAGMMAAIAAAECGAEVTMIEKNEKLGKKIYITGKGRCNLTNACAKDELFDNFVTNKKFLYSAVNSFDNRDVCTFFEDRGLKLKTERGNRVFPVSDKSSDVIKVLSDECKRLGVKVMLNTEVLGINENEGCVSLHSEKPESATGRKRGNAGEYYLDSDALIVATGGLTYPSTGSTGDGYVFAEKTGHKLVDGIPSLIDIVLKDDVSNLQGLSLRNVSVQVINNDNDKVLFEDFGEMLFTDKGVSGPIILSASSVCGRKIAESGAKLSLEIDLKPALDDKKLDDRIVRDFDEAKNKSIKNVLQKLMPSALIGTVLMKSGIDPDEKVNNITKEQRHEILRTIKHLSFKIRSLGPLENAVITKGGIDVKDINPKTMESKLKKHLYFAGEVLDVDALTGGFNLQIAFSTGYAAGNAAGKEEYETDSDRWTCRCREKYNSKKSI